MLYAHPAKSQNQRAITLAAFGQTWHFTKPAISALKLSGMGSHNSLKALVVNLGTSAGMTEGTHEVDHHGVELRLIVAGDRVLVEDPYYQ